VQTFAHHYGASATGIDFNPVAIARAREVAALAAVDVDFVVADLFAFEPDRPFDLVTSLGALHHTNDCLAAVRRCATTFVATGGTFFLGLYHAHGRRPFLQAFAERRRAGVSEETLFDAYARLRPHHHADPTFLRSWFRDQVLHPHETQHTLAEIVPVLEGCGLTFVATSINDFAPITDREALYRQEALLFDRGRQALDRGEFFPGFFIVVARKAA
jgi:SAM-dependent methyltransferase